MTETGDRGLALIAAREKSILLAKLDNELYTLICTLKTILPFDVMPVTTNSSAEDVSPSLPSE